jgi:hypothetical protein
MTEYEQYMAAREDPAFQQAVKAARRLIDTLPIGDRRFAALDVALGYDALDGLGKLVREARTK